MKPDVGATRWTSVCKTDCARMTAISILESLSGTQREEEKIALSFENVLPAHYVYSIMKRREMHRIKHSDT